MKYDHYCPRAFRANARNTLFHMFFFFCDISLPTTSRWELNIRKHISHGFILKHSLSSSVLTYAQLGN